MKMSLPIALSFRKQSKVLSLTLFFLRLQVPTFIRNIEEVTINVKVRKVHQMQFLYSQAISAKNLGMGDTTLTNHEPRPTQVRRKLVQLLQQVHCEALRKEKNCYGMGSGVEGMSGGWKKITINNRDLYARPARPSQAWLKSTFLLVELAQKQRIFKLEVLLENTRSRTYLSSFKALSTSEKTFSSKSVFKKKYNLELNN